MRLNDVTGLFEDLDYPATTNDVVAAQGSRELDLPNGSETVGQAIGRCGDQSFADAEEVRLTLLGGLSENAIGRKGYSDRDPPMIGEADVVSF